MNHMPSIMTRLVGFAIAAALIAFVALALATAAHSAGGQGFLPNDSGYPPCADWWDTGNFKLVLVQTPWGTLEYWGYACVSPGPHWERVF